MIEVQEVAKRFGKVDAAVSVSFNAPDGAITTLLGANGSGKSTTFRAIYGVIQPDAGRVLIDGYDVTRVPQRARARLGAAPDDFGFANKLTAREQITFFGRLHGLRGRALRYAVDQAAERMRLGTLLDRRVEGFSLGEKMKTALACTLVHTPKNFVFDEPMRGLDVEHIRHLRSVLNDLRARGCCVLLSTHVLSEVSALSDQVVVIAHGRTVASGTPEQIAAKAGGDLEEAFLMLGEKAREEAGAKAEAA
jgi:sodium transport system ATP-binding protein